ncbi:MAG: glycine zipper 2TM domain-containing protein [Pseudomonadota bacterium]|nr:glycine zipper 2TM domain-containing protein [Pseudomonadota bacterium]
MKTIALTAAAASLTMAAAPANAADIAPGSANSAAISLTAIAAYDDDDRWDRDDYYEDRRYSNRGRKYRRDRVYDRRGRYIEPRRISRRDRVWRGRDGRVYCERDNGTTGLVIGAGVGALLGRTIDTRGDRTVGTLLGGALGAVLGREIDRGDVRCR